MIYYCDYDIMEQVMSGERNYKKLPGHSFTLVCSCPVCGDSAKDTTKARFRCYEHKGSLRVGCFNCNYNQQIGEFLKQHKPDYFREWLLERRKEQGLPSYSERKENTLDKFQAKMPVIESLPFCQRLDTLPENHPIIKYVANRCIPKERYNLLWFTMEWRKLVNNVKPETYRNDSAEPRLVIPIFNANKEIESFQGRALRSTEKSKYITIKAHENASKIYGLDRADPSKPVYFLEGPIDSLFIDNGCAITGGSMGLEEVPFKGVRVWSLDNEPRAKETVARLEKLVKAGEQVVMWDRSPWRSKDINDMIKNEGATTAEIMDYMRANTVSGLMAQLRFDRYCKF